MNSKKNIPIDIGVFCWFIAMVISALGAIIKIITNEGIQWIVVVGWVLVAIADTSVIVVTVKFSQDNHKATSGIFELVLAGVVISILDLFYVFENRLSDYLTISGVVCISQCGTILMFWLDYYLATREQK